VTVIELPETTSDGDTLMLSKLGYEPEKTYWPTNKNKIITIMDPTNPYFTKLFFAINFDSPSGVKN
jgi:hypothetical protein